MIGREPKGLRPRRDARFFGLERVTERFTARAWPRYSRAITAPRRYIATERVPNFTSAVRVIPGTSRKLGRNIIKIHLINAAARFVVRLLNRLAIFVGRKGALADPAYFALGRTMRNIIECFDLNDAGIASADEPISREWKRASASTGAFNGISVKKVEPEVSTDPTETLAIVKTTEGSDAVSRTRSWCFRALSYCALALSRSPRALTSS